MNDTTVPSAIIWPLVRPPNVGTIDDPTIELLLVRFVMVKLCPVALSLKLAISKTVAHSLPTQLIVAVSAPEIEYGIATADTNGLNIGPDSSNRDRLGALALMVTVTSMLLTFPSLTTKLAT